MTKNRQWKRKLKLGVYLLFYLLLGPFRPAPMEIMYYRLRAWLLFDLDSARKALEWQENQAGFM